MLAAPHVYIQTDKVLDAVTNYTDSKDYVSYKSRIISAVYLRQASQFI